VGRRHCWGTIEQLRNADRLVNFVMTASEFGNQLQTRSDALFKQLGLRDGRDARELALSTHLQDTEPTDFIHLYDWLSASEDGCAADWLRRHLIPDFQM
jgi:hypothetical protein